MRHHRKAMKPDVFLKLYPGDWLKDTMHLDATAQGAYFLLILAHRGRPGLPSDDQTLRTIARVRECDWARVKAQIREFFQETDGLWVNNRSVEDWERDCAEFKASQERTKNASAARWNKDVTDSVTDSATHNVTVSQSESESESFAEREQPDLNEVLFWAEKAGLAKWKAEDWFNEMQGCGWLDHLRRPIVNWQAVIARVKVKWEEDGRPSGPPKSKAYATGSSIKPNPRNAGDPTDSNEFGKQIAAEVARRAKAQNATV